MLRYFVLVVVGLLLVAEGITAQTCVVPDPRHAPFCGSLLSYQNATVSSLLFADHTAVYQADRRAQEHYDTLANMYGIVDIILSNECEITLKHYTCHQGFPGCDTATGLVLPTCRSMCQDYCRACRDSTQCGCRSYPDPEDPDVSCHAFELAPSVRGAIGLSSASWIVPQAATSLVLAIFSVVLSIAS